MKIILASQSAGRKRLLGSLGLKFDTLPADADERTVVDKKPSLRVQKIAKLKAETIYQNNLLKHKEDFLIIAGDSFVYQKGQYTGKPANLEEARKILKKLSGTIHFLYSGCYLILQKKGKITKVSFYDKTKVTFRKIAAGEIDEFINRVDVVKLAGSYNLESRRAGKSFIKKIEGSESNVIGLPLEKLKKKLFKLGIKSLK